MPELPEVETVVRELGEKIIGKVIDKIEENYRGTVRCNESSLFCLKEKEEDYLSHDSMVKGAKIIGITRRGKYIIITTDTDYEIIVHLRMTGKLINSSPNDSLKHIRALFYFTDSTYLIFNDPRTFGKIYIIPKGKTDMVIRSLGPEPFSQDFSAEYLFNRFSKMKTTIRNALLNQEIVAGLGNIYVCEILYDSGIMFDRSVSALSKAELKKIVKSTREILTEAIKCNGTTISDFRSVDDKTGTFQNFLKVYGKKTCPQGHQISRVKAGGRSSYFCDKCQK